jgi:hypothetical protein
MMSALKDVATAGGFGISSGSMGRDATGGGGITGLTTGFGFDLGSGLGSTILGGGGTGFSAGF